MWKRVNDAVTSVREEGTRVVKSFPTDEITSTVSKLANASTEEISRYSTFVKKETDKISHDLETATRCQVCDNHISTTLVVTKMKELVKCSVCGLKCCSKCCTMSTEPIPDHFWHPSIKERPTNGRGPYCTLFCRDKLVDFWLARSCAMLRQDFFDTLDLYLSFSKTEKISKPFATRDGHMRKGKRILTLAGYAADVIGYKKYIKLITYVAQGHSVLSLLLQNDYISLLYPLMELLEGFGIQGPEGLLRVWYYACHCELQRKMDVTTELVGLGIGRGEGDAPPPGVLASTCPQSILDYVGQYMGPSQWLYSAMGLPDPHGSEEWTRWYLSRLVGVEGWVLLACSVTATDHYDIKCPAFALVARQIPHGSNDGDCEGVKKEALLVIRGSSSLVDVKINMNDKMRSFTYWQGTGNEGDGPLQPVEGQVHETMLDGALKILDLYGMRSCLSQLLESGFDVKIVGHSLGASTACLLAAEIKNGYADAFNQQETNQQQRRGSRGAEKDGEDSVSFSGSIPRVLAIGFGCPPCMDASLGDALLADDLFLSVVHRDDLVPRLSRYTLERLADRVEAYADEASRMRREDTESLKSYALTYGLAHDMSERQTAVEKKEEEKKGEERQLLDEVDASLLLIDDDEEEEDDRNVGGDSQKAAVEIKQEERSTGGGSAKVLVVPGKIIYLSYSQGAYRATLCDWRLAALSEVTPIQSAVINHSMRAHIVAMHSLLLSSSTRRISPPQWQPIFDRRLANSCGSLSEGGAETDGGWARCYVCDSDPTWPYITSSDASRGMAVHNCRSCGRVVCAVCAQAGDKIPADGIGKYQKLSDHRMALPFMGLPDKQRVCTPCFLHSYERVTALAVDSTTTTATTIAPTVTATTIAPATVKSRSGSITL